MKLFLPACQLRGWSSTKIPLPRIWYFWQFFFEGKNCDGIPHHRLVTFSGLVRHLGILPSLTKHPGAAPAYTVTSYTMMIYIFSKACKYSISWSFILFLLLHIHCFHSLLSINYNCMKTCNLYQMAIKLIPNIALPSPPHNMLHKEWIHINYTLSEQGEIQLIICKKKEKIMLSFYLIELIFWVRYMYIV